MLCQAFDELLLLQRGGTTIYAGPLGKKSSVLMDYFEALGVDRCKPGYNPATWMLEITTPAAEERSGLNYTTIFTESGASR